MIRCDTPWSSAGVAGTARLSPGLCRGTHEDGDDRAAAHYADFARRAHADSLLASLGTNDTAQDRQSILRPYIQVGSSAQSAH